MSIKCDVCGRIVEEDEWDDHTFKHMMNMVWNGNANDSRRNT